MYLRIRYCVEPFIALIIVLLLAPILLLAALYIKVDSPGPVFFMQTRMGRNRIPFSIYKFRTMHYKKTSLQLTQGEEDSRITNAGKLLRKLHLDEMVQLINVIKGEMSIIGPRPEVPEYVTSSSAWDYALSIKPGITGLTALKLADWEYGILKLSLDSKEVYLNRILPRKLRVDAIYVKNLSFALDCRIIMLSVKRILNLLKV